MDRRAWAGLAALAVGLLLFLAVVRTGLGGVGEVSRRSDQAQPAPRDPNAPPVVGDTTGLSHKTPADAPNPGDGTATEGDEGDEPGAVGSSDASATAGPVGELTSLDLETVALEPPPGGVSLVTPEFSPDGKHVLAISGKTAVKTVWVLDVDQSALGWVQIPAVESLSEPSWIDNQTVALVREDKLFSYKLDGRMFALVDESDEPGKVIQPVAAPDGNLVAYVSVTTTNGGGDIRVLNRATSVVRNITSNRARVGEPAWRSDSKAVVGTVRQEVTVWALNQSDPLYHFPRAYPAKTPGFWDQAVQWQEGSSFAVNFVVAEPPEPPRILVRKGLASVDGPVPVAAGFAWISSLSDKGTIWAVRKDGSAIAIESDAAFASQPDVVERSDGVWIAFTSAEEGSGMTRIHVARLDPKLLGLPAR